MPGSLHHISAPDYHHHHKMFADTSKNVPPNDNLEDLRIAHNTSMALELERERLLTLCGMLRQQSERAYEEEPLDSLVRAFVSVSVSVSFVSGY